MDKIPWQEYIEFEDSYYTATTSLVVDKKNGNKASSIGQVLSLIQKPCVSRYFFVSY